ncbi:transcriptional regulator atrx [Holotrichia oblita]|uniref:Transcriptional regulator atrx n=1 Tax=Holotrichia oblita TaxID=644536 RepID=A0ACB9T8L7_HOLOL|nr:transcriptional regulator atrx [Holotrichia oblita]
MEDLLTPQICMDIDETPIDVGKDDTTDDSSSESNEPEMGDDEKVKLLLEEKFTDSAQVPDELTNFEKEAKRNVFAIGEPAVQFQRLHCTACNIHLGSAPIGYFNRYIHPLLKVLLCKVCYDFYCSGEFDKDEDGSEMYCRWCGQGGKVMCCAQCAYVFCQKCVRQNLGKRTLELIKDSDDWLCFGCNPTQLINLKIICTSLFDFVQDEIRLSKSLNNIERLKVDHSVCCQKVKNAKRKRDEDTLYIPHTDWEEPKPKRNILKICKPTIVDDNLKAKDWNRKEEAEVVCTPDLSTLMETAPPPLASAAKSVESNKSLFFSGETNKEVNHIPLKSKETVITLPKLIRPEGKKMYTIAPKTMVISNANNFQRMSTNFIRFQAPAVKFVPSINKLSPILSSIPAQITPGAKHEWYDKAAAVVATITSTLSTTLINLTKEQKGAKSVEQLANIHNKLQELLSSSVNSLIQVRKNLRAEFLDDLNKLKFSSTYSYRNNLSSMKSDTKSSVNIEKSDENEEDDDVIIVNSETSSNRLLSEPPPLVKISSEKSNLRPYLKVRSVSQLLTVSSECITIPDDPPGSIESDVVPVQETDPLKFNPDTSEQCPTITESKQSNDDISLGEPLDELTIKEKNMLTEKKIDQLATEHMKLKILDVPECELKRILSVHVLISTDFRENLPDSRLKLLGSHISDTDFELPEHSVEENQIQSIDSNLETNFDNSNNVTPVELNAVVENNVTLTPNEAVANENGKCDTTLNDENQYEEEQLQENLDINNDFNLNEVDDRTIANGDNNAAEEIPFDVLNEVTNSNTCDTSNSVVSPDASENAYESQSSISYRNQIAKESGSEGENAE